MYGPTMGFGGGQDGQHVLCALRTLQDALICSVHGRVRAAAHLRLLELLAALQRLCLHHHHLKLSEKHFDGDHPSAPTCEF